ncbi:hypothetical protein PGB90_006361 [Kerria lacca]
MSAARKIHKLFVSNIPWTISNTELKNFFSNYGHVYFANVVFDKETGLSKGYGFVSFSSSASIDTVMNVPYLCLEGHNLLIQPTN